MKRTWSSKPISFICRLVNGRAFKPSDWQKSGLPIIRIQNLNDPTKPFNYFQGKHTSQHLVDDGDVLLSWSGTPGTSFGCFVWSRGKAILNQHIFKVHVDDGQIDKEFFVHAVNSRLGRMIELAHGGVGLRHITKAKLESIELPVPPIEEQRRIVGRIKEMLERADEIRALHAAIASERKILLTASLSELFTVYERSAPLLQIGELLMDSRYGTSRKCYSTGKGLPVLRIPNIGQGLMNTEGLKYCDLEDREWEALKLQDGDLLVVRTNGSPDLVGRCAVFHLKGDFAFASYIIRLRLDVKRVNPDYLMFFLSSSRGRDAIRSRYKTSAGQYNISSSGLRSVSFPCPNLVEQDLAVARMKSQQKLINELSILYASSESRARMISGSILQKAFAGEL